MEYSQSYDNCPENHILNTAKYIEELVLEFGVLHPLVHKNVENLIKYLEGPVCSGHSFSADFLICLERFFDRLAARIAKAKNEEKQKEKDSWLLFGLGCVLTLGAGALLYHCFRKKDPIDVLHHHSGSVTDNINIHHSGHVTENIRIG